MPPELEQDLDMYMDLYGRYLDEPNQSERVRLIKQMHEIEIKYNITEG
ncbi:hypothetical protein [Paenibacillus selenitireducens]|nr:hypothetical protein [Paenibacillus selenitireducens]